MKKQSALLRKITGTILFIVGVVSLILPLIPGWLFIGVGLYILSLDSPGLQSRIRGIRAHYPWFDRLMQKVDERFGKKEEDDILPP